MKKITFFVTLLMALSMSLSAWADYTRDVVVDGVAYRLDDDNYTAIVFGKSSLVTPTGDVVIRASITDNGNTYTVVEIEIQAFYGCSGITSVVVPEGIIELPINTFHTCTGLKSLRMRTIATPTNASSFRLSLLPFGRRA